jgi:hypothetical protein
MCPYYRDNGGGTHGNREPSHPHDMHQYSCSLIVAGKTDPGDVSHINTDPTTNGTGRTMNTSVIPEGWSADVGHI